MNRIESLVEEWRRQLEITGFPTLTDTWRLAAELAPRLYVEVFDCDAAWVQVPTSGPAFVVIPERWDRYRQSEALLEEIGHVLLRENFIVAPEAGLLTDDQRSSLFKVWHLREERRCEEWRLRWKLPSRLLFQDQYPTDEELAEQARVSVEDVRRRLRLQIGESW